jgi:hypothetical protein
MPSASRAGRWLGHTFDEWERPIKFLANHDKTSFRGAAYGLPAGGGGSVDLKIGSDCRRGREQGQIRGVRRRGSGRCSINQHAPATRIVAGADPSAASNLPVGIDRSRVPFVTGASRSRLRDIASIETAT